MYNHPCKKDCQNRSVGCHGICGEYKAFRDKLEESNKPRRKFYDAQNYTFDAIEKNRRSIRR